MGYLICFLEAQWNYLCYLWEYYKFQNFIGIPVKICLSVFYAQLWYRCVIIEGKLILILYIVSQDILQLGILLWKFDKNDEV